MICFYVYQLFSQIVRNKNSGCVKVSRTETNISVVYNAANAAALKALTVSSVYCTQELSYDCIGAELNLAPPYEWYTLQTNERQAYWSNNTGQVLIS